MPQRHLVAEITGGGSGRGKKDMARIEVSIPTFRKLCCVSSDTVILLALLKF